MDTIKVYIADGSELIREAVRSVLLHSSFIFVSGHSGNGEKAFNEIKQTIPDVVLVDVSLPVMDGWTLSKILKNTLPSIKIIIMSMNCEVEYLDYAAATGVNGYILKDETDDFINAICTVMSGDVFISGILLDNFRKRNCIGGCNFRDN